MSKSNQVLMHLQKKPITSWEAITKYRVTRLADVIFRLKKRGHNIVTWMVDDGEVRFARYYLVKEKK
jgi:hypothetical protein